MDKDKRQLNVSAIKDGTVIDHIPVNNVFKVIRILDLENKNNQMLFGDNLESKKYGRKGLIKVQNAYFTEEEINKIALVAPTATIIEIKDFNVTAKRDVQVPDEIYNLVKCINPNCITNIEQIPTRFNVVDKQNMKLQCHYCEKFTDKDNIDFL